MSESKLKALKVVELKDILARAQVSLAGKANKSDLIAKILASNDALAVYHQLHDSPPANGVPASKKATDAAPSAPAPALATPQTFTMSDTTPHPATAPAAPATTTTTTAAEPPKDAAAPSAPPPAATTAAEDEELARRKARAERFNIPLVEPPKPKPAKATPPAKNNNSIKATAVIDDPEKLDARAKRFGITKAAPAATPTAPANSRKRSAPVETAVDAEEEERRRKRAERFGLPVTQSQSSVKA